MGVGTIKVPQPNIPAASEKTSLEVEVAGVPFQPSRNALHHIKSAKVETDIVVGSSAK